MELRDHGTAQRLVALILLVYFGAPSTSQITSEDDPDLKQYCQWESFNATCERDEVILMISARYGRMRYGGCVKENHGHIGCSADVISHLDRVCSGRQSCVMSIPDAELHQVHACPSELMAYLEAKYTCVKVATASKQVCGRSVPLELENQSGFISSAVADESGFGTIMCPWQLRADKGQHFRLSIFNFHHTVTATTAAISQKGKFCEPYISVRDNKEVLNISACFGENREREVYVSDTNVIQIGIIPTRRQAQQPRRFLVKYEAIGCPDPAPRVNAVIKRTEDTAMVMCNTSSETFFLTCDLEGQWVGDAGNCSSAASWKGHNAKQNGSRFPYGILVVIGIGVALGVAMGIILLMGILICIQRRKERKLRSATTDPLLDDHVHDRDETQLQCGCGAKVYYATRLECELALRNQQQMALRSQDSLHNAEDQKLPTEGAATIPRPLSTSRASEPTIRPLPMPDMCLVDTRKHSQPRDLGVVAPQDKETSRQLQTSFITFKPNPQARLTSSPCRSCTLYEQRPTLRRADKSSSALPHYGILAPKGELYAPEDSVQSALLDKRPSNTCAECIQERSAGGEVLEAGNKSV